MSISSVGKEYNLVKLEQFKELKLRELSKIHGGDLLHSARNLLNHAHFF